MTLYNKDQEYTLKVVNTAGETKEIKYTPNKDMSKPEMIMALKSKYKNFFKLIEGKTITADELKIGDIYIDRSHNLQKVLDRPMPEKDLGITRKQLTKMFIPNKQNLKGTKWELEKIRPATEEDFNNYPLIESKTLDEFSNLTEEHFTCGRCLKCVDLDYNVEDYVIDPKTGEAMCRDCAIKAGIPVDDDLNENVEIENHRQKKLDELHSDIKYNFEEAYKDWGNEVSKTKSGFVNEYMSEFCNDFDEVNWRKYIVAISEVEDIYEEYKDTEDWEIPEDIKIKLYELITDYVQNYLRGVYSKKEESKNTINEKSLSDFLGNIDNAWSLDITQTKSNGTKVYVVRRLANSKYTAEDIKNKIETEFNLNGDITSDNKEIWLSAKKVENKSTEGNSVIVVSYGKGTRFPDRDTAIRYYEDCVAGTDRNSSENYSYQNILYSLKSTDKPVVYDIDDETEYDWWVQKGKPTEDISDELLKAHLGESKDMKKEDLSDRDIKELDEYTDNEIKKMYDDYCSENSECKSFEEWQKENVDSALINELEYEFFSNRKKTESSDIDEKVVTDGFVGQPLSMLLTYLGDGHDIADKDYDSVVFFPPVDEIDDADNYDLYVQGLSQILNIVEPFDVNDVVIVVNLTDYVTANKDTLLDLFEVDGETDEEIMEDLVCRVMPSVISGYTTDNVYKILLSTVKGGK